MGADTYAFANTYRLAYQSENLKHGLEFRKQGVEIVFFEKVFAKKLLARCQWKRVIIFASHDILRWG